MLFSSFEVLLLQQNNILKSSSVNLFRLTKDWPRFKDELETLKFICTDFWTSVYKKQIDNLRTNHQGVYVLQDNAFRFLNKISAGSQYLEHAPKVMFLCRLNWAGLQS